MAVRSRTTMPDTVGSGSPNYHLGLGGTCTQGPASTTKIGDCCTNSFVPGGRRTHAGSCNFVQGKDGPRRTSETRGTANCSATWTLGGENLRRKVQNAVVVSRVGCLSAASATEAAAGHTARKGKVALGRQISSAICACIPRKRRMRPTLARSSFRAGLRRASSLVRPCWASGRAD